MQKNRKKIVLIVLVSIIVISLAISTAYLMTDILPSLIDPLNIGANTDKLTLVYTDCADNKFHCENINKDLSLGESVEKTFQIKNESNRKMSYTLYFKHLQNTFKSDELVYKIENLDTGEILTDTTPVPYREVKIANVTIKNSIEIEGNTTQNYKMTVTFLNKDYSQNANLNAKYSIKLSIIPSDQKLTETISNELIRVNSDYNEKIWQHKADIKKIIFEDTLNPKENASYVYDISSAQNESVMSYLVSDTEDETKYIAYIQSDGEAVANGDSSHLFKKFSALETIDNLNNLNTSKVTTMSYMFTDCNRLTTLDLSNFDTSKVTSMISMFYGCNSLTTLDVSNFETSNVTDMRYMFYNCNSLITLDVSHFDTSNVFGMAQMFYGCRSLTALDVSNFDTSKATAMNGMFYDCSSLSTLNVSNFETSNVSDMSWMFQNCSRLITIDVSNFHTSSVTHMRGMFAHCKNLTVVDLSNFDTSKVTNMQSMFLDCSNLTAVDVSNFDTGNVNDISYMFSGCSSLTILDVNNFNTINVTNMSYMFYGCNNLTTLVVSNFNTSSVNNISYMFSGCSSLTTLDISNFSVNNVTNMQSMFENMSKLETIYATDWTIMNENIAKGNSEGFGGVFNASSRLPNYTKENISSSHCKPTTQGGYFTNPNEKN